MAVHPVEAQGRAPVVDDERDPLADAELLEERVEMAAVLDEAIRVRAARDELVGVAHPDEIGRDAASRTLEVRDHVAPEIRRRRVAVQEDDGIALPDLDVCHPPAVDRGVLLRVALAGIDHGISLLDAPGLTGLRPTHTPSVMPTRPPRILLLGFLVALVGVRPSDATTGGRTLVGLRGRDDAGLRALLAVQQDPASPEYRHWLTPQHFGERFGASPRDLKRVERWLRADGCRVRRARGRQQVECVGATPGAVPVALAPLVDDVVDLGMPVELEHKLDLSMLQPNSVAPDGTFFFTPAEYAGFYGFADLHANGIDGTGQRIGIVGTVPVDVPDIAAFQSTFGLPPLELEQVGTPGPN